MLASVMAVYPEGRDGAPAVIDDVIRHANVSRGTFYKYFTSLEAAVQTLASRLADEMASTVMAVYEPLNDVVSRTATGFQLYLLRAHADHRWGAFLAHMGLLKGGSLMLEIIRTDIENGRKSGDYDIDSVDVAVDLLLGAKIEAISRIISQDVGAAYIQTMTGHVLRSFGVSRARAGRAVQTAFDRIMTEGPTQISWWSEELSNVGANATRKG